MDPPHLISSHDYMPPHDDAARSALLLRLARHVTARHDLDDVLGEVFSCLRPLVEFGGGSIQLLDDEGYIRMAAADPVAPAQVMAQRVPLGTSIGGRVILTEQPVYLPDIGASGRADSSRVSDGVRSYLGVPLVADGRAIGLLQLDSPVVDAWCEDDRSMFFSVAPIVAAAIQSARAYARANVAQLRVQLLEARVAQAQAVIATVRAVAGHSAEVEQELRRLEDVLAPRDALVVSDGLPQPRVVPQAAAAEPTAP